MNKQDFENAIKEVCEKPFKMRFIKNGKYGKPECWIYPLENPKQQKIRFRNNMKYIIVDDNNKPIMESKSGLLVTLETLLDKKYLKEYLESCF